MLCGEMQKCVEDSRSLLSIPKRRQSLAEGKLLSVRDALQFSWGFLCLSFCCRNNTTNDRDVLGLFLSVFSSCLLLLSKSLGLVRIEQEPVRVFVSVQFHCRFQLQKRRQLSPARATKRFPLSRCASAIQIVRPLESTAETQPQLQPALLSLSAMISQLFTRPDSASFALHMAMPKRGFWRLPNCSVFRQAFLLWRQK